MSSIPLKKNTETLPLSNTASKEHLHPLPCTHNPSCAWKPSTLAYCVQRYFVVLVLKLNGFIKKVTLPLCRILSLSKSKDPKDVHSPMWIQLASRANERLAIYLVQPLPSKWSWIRSNWAMRRVSGPGPWW